MREIRDTGKVVGADRIAVMAALNMANELLRLRKQDAELQGAVSGRVKNMRERVEDCASAHAPTRSINRNHDHFTNDAPVRAAFSDVALAPEDGRVAPALPVVFDSKSGYLSTVM